MVSKNLKSFSLMFLLSLPALASETLFSENEALCKFDLPTEGRELPINSWGRTGCSANEADIEALSKCGKYVVDSSTDRCEITERSSHPGDSTCYMVHWSLATLYRRTVLSPDQLRSQACTLVSKCLQEIAESENPDSHEVDLKRAMIFSKAYNCSEK